MSDQQSLSAKHSDARAQKIIHFYEHLEPQSLGLIAGVYSEDAVFKDPFNAVQGVAAIQTIFSHMFTALEQPRFTVTQAILEGSNLCLSWEFHFSRKGLPRPMCIVGTSLLQLGPDGRIQDHRDYWDTGEELFQKIPVLGAFMRFLQKQLRTPIEKSITPSKS